MIYLLESEFTINWATLASLLIGMFLGVVLFILIYILVTLRQIKDSTYTVSDVIKDVSYDEIKEEIIKAKKEFLIRKEEEKNEISWPNIRDTSFNLIKTIAKKFYPNSKEPLGELTIEELILLDHYIVEKFEALFNKRFIKPWKKISVTKILTIINAKNTVENSPVVKGIKKTGIKTIFSSAYSVVKIINPASWINKLFIKPLTNQIIKQICLTIIEVVGQETYHVYSKQAFLEPVDDSELEYLLNQMSHENDEQIEYENDFD